MSGQRWTARDARRDHGNWQGPEDARAMSRRAFTAGRRNDLKRHHVAIYRAVSRHGDTARLNCWTVAICRKSGIEQSSIEPTMEQAPTRRTGLHSREAQA